MSLLQSTESVYSQIEDKSVFYTNQTIKGIEDQLAVGSFALGSINRQIHYGFNTNVVLSDNINAHISMTEASSIALNKMVSSQNLDLFRRY